MTDELKQRVERLRDNLSTSFITVDEQNASEQSFNPALELLWPCVEDTKTYQRIVGTLNPLDSPAHIETELKKAGCDR